MRRILFVMVLVAVVISGCAGLRTPSNVYETPYEEVPDEHPEYREESAPFEDFRGGEEDTFLEASEPTAEVENLPEKVGVVEASPEPALDGAKGPPPPSDSPYESISEDELRQQASTLLLAGYNDSWKDFLDYRGQNAEITPPAFLLDFDHRVMIKVVNGEGEPVANYSVSITNGNQGVTQGVTYATGNFPYYCYEDTRHTARIGRKTVDFECVDETIEVKVGRAEPTTKLDLLVLVDSTGSMSDEINDLQANVQNVASLISEEVSDVRYGFVTYRDTGDAYLTRASDFADIDSFRDDLHQLSANGGGDTPEAMSVGMQVALEQSWREDAIRLVILIADAPPHERAYFNRILDSLEQGIKFYTVAASGLDTGYGEFIFRQIAALTEGKFVFLTYDDANTQREPGGETAHDVDDYTVGRLDVLLVRLIEDEMSHQMWGTQQ
jgi:hypothetical protein